MRNTIANPLEKKWEMIKSDFLQKHPNVSNCEELSKKKDFDDLCRRLGVNLGKTRLEILEEIKNWPTPLDS